MTKISIYNDRNELLNIAVEKAEAHQKGLWHRTFICILINKHTNSIILQRKSKDRYIFERPDYLDISACGHYDEGEEVPAGVRELQEELGLNPKFEELISLGVRQNSVILGENYHNNEFQHIFAYVINEKLENIAFNPEDEEVTSVVELNIEETIKLLTEKVSKIDAKDLNFKSKKISNVEITLNDFVPDFLKMDKFILRLFGAGNRILKGDFEKGLLFW